MGYNKYILKCHMEHLYITPAEKSEIYGKDQSLSHNGAVVYMEETFCEKGPSVCTSFFDT